MPDLKESPAAPGGPMDIFKDGKEEVAGASSEAQMYRAVMDTLGRLAETLNAVDGRLGELEVNVDEVLDVRPALYKPNGSIDWDALAAPFHPDDLEWKPQITGAKNGRPWARVVPYVTARAIDDRFDLVIGPDRWAIRYKALPDGGLMAEIGVLGGSGDWIWKGDGAGPVKAGGGLSESDAAKGTFSNSKKRAAVPWGVGRYLYRLESYYATVFPADSNRGRFFAKVKADQRKGISSDIPFRWDPPDLPPWALPGGAGRPASVDPVEEAVERVKNLVSDLRKYAGENAPADVLKIVEGAEALATGERPPLDRLTNAIPVLEGLLDRRGND